MQTIYDAKILIVDDNQDLLNLVTTALRSTGYNQLTACTGCAAAQAAFAANRPDLMILDINLPDGDGFTLFRTLHSMADIPALSWRISRRFFFLPAMLTPTGCLVWDWARTTT